MTDQYFFPFDQKNPFLNFLTAITVSRHLFHHSHRKYTVVDRKEPDTPKPEPEKPETPNPDKPRPEEPDKPEEKPGKPGGPEHESPRTPEFQPVLRIGRILAWYRPSSPDGAAWLYLGPDGLWRIRLPAMGDERKTLVWCALFVMTTAFLGALCGRKKTTEGKNTENRTK